MILCYNLPYLLVILIFDDKNAEISQARSLSPLLHSKFSLTVMQINFQGKTSSEMYIPPFAYDHVL